MRRKEDRKIENIWSPLSLTLTCFSFRKDIINYRDINLISFFNCEYTYFVLNIYSDNQQLALTYLKDMEVNLNNILIMTGDFDIRDSNWDPSFLHYSVHADTLRKIADLFNLELFMLIN